MSDRPSESRAVREARKAFKPVQPETTETEYAKLQKAIQDNRERLKSERLAREAAAGQRSR